MKVSHKIGAIPMNEYLITLKTTLDISEWLWKQEEVSFLRTFENFCCSMRSLRKSLLI